MSIEKLAFDERDAILAAVLRASLDCVIVIDEQGLIQEYNEAAESTFGWPRAEALGRSLSELIIPPRFRGGHDAGMARYMAEGGTRFLGERVTIDAMRADGTEFPVELAITETAVGTRRLFAASIRDLSGQRAAEAALRLSERRLAAFMENAPVGMYLKDGEGRLVMANPEMALVFGRPVEEILGKRSEDMLPPDEAEVVTENDRRVRESRRAHSVEEHIPGLDRYAWTLVVRFPIEVDPGDPLYIGGFDIDITAMKRAEEEIARSRQALNQHEKLSALGLLLAGVAHELNNPLAILMGQAALLADDVEGGPLAERAEKIRRAAERCSRIVRTFLSIARQKPPARQSINMRQVAQSALELLSYGLRTSGITATLKAGGEEAMVLGDPDQLHQVVVNLIVNAQQALADRDLPRIIDLRVRRAGSTVILEVADNGTGVRPEIRGRIFEPFFTTKAVGSGTGIGLSYSYGVISAHDGVLELVPSTVGALFRVSLPAAEDLPVAAAAIPDGPRTNLAGRRILVVEDEADVAATLRDLLAGLGMVVETADSGEAALALLRTSSFDALLSDLRMPGMGGPAFYRRVQADFPNTGARTGFITGDSLGAAAAEFLAWAGRPSIGKPFTREQVVELVEGLLANSADSAT